MRLNLALCLGLALGLTHGKASEPVKPEQFGKLHSLIKPNAGEEKFMEIPWMIDLWEARKKAASEDKPILLWEMDGHPLGCV
ncbi:MAG: hypothetical protein EBT92_04995 [Planctomycetes bacterium]|nr:hypothetical protein [Planctomycetota bacterium]NBY00637.1 hypothetical protein [Planctomycetota bacterium]